MSIFFDDTDALVRILVVGTLAYIALVAIIRITGKRTLAQMNAFDFIVTVAFGSTLASTIVSRDVTLAQGVLALALLVLLQLIVAFVSVRIDPFLKLVKSEPRLLYRDGRFLREAMRRERVTEAEVLQAVRNQGIASMQKVAAIVLETNGSFSILQGAPGDEQSTLRNVAGG